MKFSFEGIGMLKFRISFEMVLKFFLVMHVQIQQWEHGTICEIFSKLTIKTPERCNYVYFEEISQIAPIFLLLTLNKKTPVRTA